MNKRILSVAIVLTLLLAAAPAYAAGKTPDFVYQANGFHIIATSLGKVADFQSWYGDSFYFENYSESLFLVCDFDGTATNYGYADWGGNIAIPIGAYDTMGEPFSDGLCLFRAVNPETGATEYGFINNSGEIAIAPRDYGDGFVYGFSGGLSRFSAGAKYGYMDKSGEITIPASYDYAFDFNDGLALVANGNDTGGVTYAIDSTGKVVFELPGLLPLGAFSEGYALCADETATLQNDLAGRYIVIDTKGETVSTIESDFIWLSPTSTSLEMHSGLFIITHPETLSSAAVDMSGKVVIPFDENPEHLYGGLFRTNSGAVDRDLNLIIPPEEIIPGTFDGGIAIGHSSENYYRLERHSGVYLMLGAADWALEELGVAISRGLTLDSMHGKWGDATNRLLAAETTVKLIEIATGKTIDALAEENDYDMSDTFTDTDSKAVTFLKAAGVTQGVGDNQYAPYDTYNRAQMVTMLGRAAEVFFGLSVQGTNPFTDVPDWAAPYVGWAAEAEITVGVGGGLFDSDATLQNQHTAIFLSRAFTVIYAQTSTQAELAH